MDWVLLRCPKSSRSGSPVRASQSRTDLPPVASTVPSRERAIGRPEILGSENSRLRAPVGTSQILTGSAKVWFTPAVHVASVAPSPLSAIEVIGRSPVIVPAWEDAGRN